MVEGYRVGGSGIRIAGSHMSTIGKLWPEFMQVTPEFFADRGWMTPSTIFGELLVYPVPRTVEVQHLKHLALGETERRKNLPDTYVKCPRCYGYHDQMLNIDKLCERCEAHIAPYRYDRRLTSHGTCTMVRHGKRTQTPCTHRQGSPEPHLLPR